MSQLRLGDCLLDTTDGTLTSPSGPRHLEPKVQAVLLLLIERQGEVVSQEAIFRDVWRETYVAPTALPRTISMLRHALEDDVRQPRYIETIPKRGYRLIASVERQHTAEFAAHIEPEAPPSSRGRTQPLLAFAAAIVLAVIGDHDLRPMLFGRAHDMGAFQPPPGQFHDRLWHDTRLGNETAYEYYTRELARDPGSIDAIAGLATVYAFRSNYLPDRTRWVDEAIATAQRAVTLDPSNWLAVRALAMSQMFAGRLKDAKTSFEEVLRLRPDDHASQTNLGYALMMTGHLESALGLFEQYLVAMPRWAPGLSFPAITLAVGGYEVEAARLAETGIDLEPFLPDAHLILARIDLLHGRYELARTRLQRLLEVHEDCARCAAQIGLADELQGRVNDARRRYEHVRAAFAASGAASVRLARLRMLDGDTVGAETLLRELETQAQSEIDDGVDSSQLRWLLAAAAAVRGHDDKAMQWYSDAIAAGRLDVIWDEWDPLFSTIRNRPDFVALRNRVLDDHRTVAALAARIAGRFDVARVSLEHAR